MKERQVFHAELLSFMALMRRTADVEAPEPGVKPFTSATKALVYAVDKKFPGLFEVDDMNKTLKLTAEGKIIDKWMFYVPPKPGA